MSDWIPVSCPCGQEYNAGDDLSCPRCGTPSVEATPSNVKATSSGVLLDKCVCGREYNRARLAACPGCGRANGMRRPSPPSEPATPDIVDHARRRRRWLAGGILGGGLLVLGLIFVLLARGADQGRTLDAVAVRDALESNDVNCDSVDIGGVGTIDYRCTIADQDLYVSLEDTPFSLVNAFFYCLESNTATNYAVGVNWVALSQSDLVSTRRLAEVLGGTLVTGSELCAAVEDVFPRNVDAWSGRTWEDVYRQIGG